MQCAVQFILQYSVQCTIMNTICNTLDRTLYRIVDISKIYFQILYNSFNRTEVTHCKQQTLFRFFWSFPFPYSDIAVSKYPVVAGPIPQLATAPSYRPDCEHFIVYATYHPLFSALYSTQSSAQCTVLTPKLCTLHRQQLMSWCYNRFT